MVIFSWVFCWLIVNLVCYPACGVTHYVTLSTFYQFGSVSGGFC